MNNTMLMFDLDGTLWDSAVQVADSWNEVLRKGAPELAHLTAEDIHSVMGHTMEEIAHMLFPDYNGGGRSQLVHECERYEVEYIAGHGGLLFKGVRDTISALRDAGYTLAIVSNCQTGYVPAFMDSMDMRKYFADYEEWGNTLHSKADNIRLVMERNHFENAIYLGDTQGDFDAAEGAGIPFIHAAYGFGKVPEAQHAINDISELPKLLKELNVLP